MNDFTPFEYLQPLPSPDKLPLLRRFDHKSLRDFISEVIEFYDEGGSMSMSITNILGSGYEGAYKALRDAWRDTLALREILCGTRSPEESRRNKSSFFKRESTLFDGICEAYVLYGNAGLFG